MKLIGERYERWESLFRGEPADFARGRYEAGGGVLCGEAGIHKCELGRRGIHKREPRPRGDLFVFEGPRIGKGVDLGWSRRCGAIARRDCSARGEVVHGADEISVGERDSCGGSGWECDSVWVGARCGVET